MSPARLPSKASALLLAALLLSSCGLLRAPVRLASGVVQGTARATEKAVTAPIEAHQRRKARKEAAEAEAAKNEKKPAQEAAGTTASEPALPDRPETAAPEDFPFIADPDLPPLPSEYSLPPVGHE